MVRIFRGKKYAYPECLAWDWKTGKTIERISVSDLPRATFRNDINGEFTCRDNCDGCNGEFSTPYNCTSTPICPHCNKMGWSSLTCDILNSNEVNYDPEYDIDKDLLDGRPLY